LTEIGSKLLHKHFFALPGKRTIGALAVGNDQITAWEFEVFNGLLTADSHDLKLCQSNRIGVFAGPASQEQMVKKQA